MSVVIRQLIDANGRAAQIQLSGPAAVFVLPALLSMWREVLGWDGLSIDYGDARAIGFEKETKIGKLFFSMPYGGYGGFVDQGTEVEREEVIAAVLRRSYLQENFVTFGSAVDGSFPAAYIRTDLTTHIIDLTAQVALSENTTRNIRKAAENKFAIAKLDSASHSKFVALLETHQKRTGEYRRMPQGCYEYLLTKSSQKDSGVSVFGASNQDGIQCIHIYFETTSDAFYFDGFSTTAGLEQGANFFLMDAMIVRLRENGIERLNLGATPPLDKGLRRFKEGWGARDVAYREYCRRSQAKRLIDFMTRLR